MSAFEDIFVGGLAVSFSVHGQSVTYRDAFGAERAVTALVSESSLAQEESADRQRLERRWRRVVTVDLSEVSSPRENEALVIGGVEWVIRDVSVLGSHHAECVAEWVERISRGARERG